MTTEVTQRTKTKIPKKTKKFEGRPYDDYTVAISDAAQNAMATEIAAMNAELKLLGNETPITAGQFVIEMATTMYERNGLPAEIYSAFTSEVRYREGSLTITCNHQDKFLVCWLTSEEEGDTMPDLHLVEGHIAQSFVPDERTLH